MKDNFESTRVLAKKILETLKTSEYTGTYEANKEEEYQAINHAIHLPITNYVYQDRIEVLEEERMKTIIKLSRVLGDTEMELAIKGLGFKVVLNSDK